MNVNYCKRKNGELFKSLEDFEILNLSNVQNYIPIYKKFFSLNETNYNNINLYNKLYITDIFKKDTNTNSYNCMITDTENNTKKENVFFKIAQLLDPYKYLVGKYDTNDKIIFQLPQLNSTEIDTYSKYMDENNAAYVDSFFVYLINNLMNTHKFSHGLHFYGSFLSIKNNFEINIIDDIEYLHNSSFFQKNKNVLFNIENYDFLMLDDPENEDNGKKHPIVIDYNSNTNETMTINENVFEDIFVSDPKTDIEINLEDITNIPFNTETNSLSLKSNSTCSSRSSYTEDDIDTNSDNSDTNSDNSDTNSDNESDIDTNNLHVNVTIPKFPVHLICMEYCENVFDDLILSKKLSTEEWLSALMQIIMILITYQKVFHFTHNDLHTNNIMYNKTNKKYIYYCYNKKYYKVPTFGKIFKIIDFGRSIYKFDGKLFCSDSFKNGEDAATQYNTEPYLNEKKPRLEPNYSFDLCRLACSIFDYIVDELDEIKDLNSCNDPIKKLIVEWCLDDKGINILYKNNGDDRYPDFKLYKMIARNVHNHTPQVQLERKEFSNFCVNLDSIPKDIINIDDIPCYINKLKNN